MSAQVVGLKTRLTRATKAEIRDNGTIVSILKELKSVHMTLDVLKATKIGVVVNKLKKDKNSEISMLSKSMVKSWRNLVKMPSSPKKGPSITDKLNPVSTLKNGKETNTTNDVRDGKAFLLKNAKRDGVVVLPSGLQYKVIRSGPPGRSPGPNTVCECNYRGTLIDGTEFDSSYKRGCSVSFPLNKVIKGWTQAMQLMKAGDKWNVYIPPQLAYKNKCKGKHIKPGEVLIFELELLGLRGEAPPKKKSKDASSAQAPEAPPASSTPTQGPPVKKRKVDVIDDNSLRCKYRLGQTNDKMRDKVQKLIYDSLGAHPSKEELFPEMEPSKRDELKIDRISKTDCAVLIESAMAKKFDGPTQGYKSYYRSLKFNLKDTNNTELNWGLLTGSLTASKLVEMTEEDMASSAMKDLRQKNIEWMIAAARCDWDRENGGGTTDIFLCENCGKRNCKYFQQQTRGADEPMTVFVTCMECGNKWRDGDNDGN